ncbi:MAG: hypothetical protein LBD88_00645 [Candidatus Peribacteria bacterium]|jgi:3-deoxy-D-arabino-heptulosonate 7-phosphate (DAHP) synthase|nr:hypothetical protein [Candidatus Peribacteria bacterium]
MKKKNVSNSSLIVDASHDNCKDENGKKHPENQIEILKYVMEQIENRPELLNLVK